MKLFDLLQTLDSAIEPACCKVHLACRNGVENPLDIYFAGNFDEWQAWQSKQNFQRPLVISLIALPQPSQWLFVGVYDSLVSNVKYIAVTRQLDWRVAGAEKRAAISTNAAFAVVAFRRKRHGLGEEMRFSVATPKIAPHDT